MSRQPCTLNALPVTKSPGKILCSYSTKKRAVLCKSQRRKREECPEVPPSSFRHSVFFCQLAIRMTSHCQIVSAIQATTRSIRVSSLKNEQVYIYVGYLDHLKASVVNTRCIHIQNRNDFFFTTYFFFLNSICKKKIKNHVGFTRKSFGKGTYFYDFSRFTDVQVIYEQGTFYCPRLPYLKFIFLIFFRIKS